jgi:membrane protein implicated in regulation of membrane protease activity
MSFWIYMLGCIILITGLAIGAYLLHAPLQWIGVGILCLVGAAIILGVKVTRQKNPPSQE